MKAWMTHLDQLPKTAHLAVLADFQSLEQQLADTNQQLTAAKEEINDANQQLTVAKEEINEANQQLTAAKEEITEANQQLADAKQEINYLRSLKFLPKTERGNGTDPELLQAEDLQGDIAEIDATLEQHTNTADKTRTKPTGRRALAAHLPRVDIRHDIQHCPCGACKTELTWIRDDITEKLHLIPAKVEVHRHIYPQYACQQCQSIARASVEPQLIAGGLPTNGTLAWLAVSKYADHLPLYRIVKILERDGLELPLSTLSGWIGTLGMHLAPLWQRLGERLKQQPILHIDETPVTQLSNVKHATKKAYIWAYRSVSTADATIIWFDYHSTRSGDCVQQFLQDWHGTVMVDDYAGYKKLIQQNELIELGCWAHVRRKFFELVQSHHSPKGQQMLDLIAKLYKIEAEAKDLAIDQRRQIRQRDAIPILDDIKQFLSATQQTAGPNSGLSRAVGHALRRWPALIRYPEHGAYPIDNNPVENAIRPIAVGKKNWLFAGSARAGKRAAVLQTLLATAKANDLNPYEWLLEVLNKLPTHPNSRLDELLPIR